MSINLETGLWQCFKTGKRGNFIYLVSLLDKKTYKQVYNEFLWKMLEAECEGKEIERIKKHLVSVKVDSSDGKWVPIQESVPGYNYLINRMISPYEFYYNAESDRIVIPYKDSFGTVFFYQERALRKEQEPKYLNFKGIKSSSILYQYDVDSFRGLYICEGVFDAISLKSLGYNATTTLSCNASREQLSQLKHYNGRLVVAYDNDEAGIHGIKRFDRLRKRMNINAIFYCQPPKEYKDWNGFLVGCKDEYEIKNYISSTTTMFDSDLYEATQL
jgi:hypothetical protein